MASDEAAQYLKHTCGASNAGQCGGKLALQRQETYAEIAAYCSTKLLQQKRICNNNMPEAGIKPLHRHSKSTALIQP